MTLLVVSDYDPEGLDLADDAIRSLRDLWGIDVDYHRAAVNIEQIEALNLAEDFNPAKPRSSRYAQFVKETGGERTWEVESLPPEFLQSEVRDAIERNMDAGVLENVLLQESEDVDELRKMREDMFRDLDLPDD